MVAQDPTNESAAEGCFRRGLSIARERQTRAWELRTAISLSRLWQRQGRGEEAQALLREISDGFSEGLDTADLQDARALLATLA